MRRSLESDPPAWVRSYIGLPWKPRGRGTDGVDCYGAVRLIYRDRFGITLPSLDSSYSDPEGSEVPEVVRSASGSGGLWVDLAGGPSAVGDLVTFKTRGVEAHVGLVVSRTGFIHALGNKGVVLEDWTSPLWARRLGRFYRYAGPVYVNHKPSIFRSECHRLELPEGGSIEDLLLAGGVDLRTPGLRVFLGDRDVPRDRWAHTKPKGGRMLTVGVVPEGGGGGGKDIFRAVLAIAVVVAAVYAGPVVATGLGYTATGSAAAIATASIALAGTLAVNALVPPPSPGISAASGDSVGTSPTITGARNEPRKYGVVPAIFGTHRVAPAFGAMPFTEIVGDDQYLRLLLVVGYGPLDLSDIRIGDTPIEEFDGVQIETRGGGSDDAPLSLYPGTVNEEAMSVLLSEPDGWTLRTTDGNTDEISLDFTFPQGLAEIKNDGSKIEASVVLDIEYAPAGSGLWTKIELSPPTDQGTLGFFFRSPESTLLRFDKASSGYERRIAWSANGAFPDALPPELAGLPATYPELAWDAGGYLNAPESGSYRFAIDCSQAGDLWIDGKVVASFYGEHPPAGSPDFSLHQSAAIHLDKGFHSFRFRVQSRDTSTMAAAMGWKRPSSSMFEIVPLANIFYRAMNVAPGYYFSIYDSSGYKSGVSVADARLEQIRRNTSWSVPRGQYDVRVRRVTADTTSDRVLDKVYWTAIRSISNEEPIRVAGLARLAVRIKATDQLSGTIEQLNLQAAAILPDYDSASGEWIVRETSNPAAAYRAVLEGPAAMKPISSSRLNLAKLAAWHQSNTTLGLAFDGVFDFDGTVYQRLQQICSAGRASFGMEDGLFSVVQDKVQNVPVQLFTPRNSRGFKGRRSFPDPPHGLRIRFLNREVGYQSDERIVLDDGYVYPDKYGVLRDAFGVERSDLPVASNFESIELFGVVDPAVVWKHGRYYIAVAKLRPETFEISTDFETLVCRRGDRVELTHDVPLLGQGFGRVRDLVLDSAGNTAIMRVDAPVEMEAGRYYAVRIRKKDGTFVLKNVLGGSGEVAELTFDPAINSAEPQPEVGDLFGFGDRGTESKDCIVKAIKWGGDLTATLTLIDHAPAVHDADKGTIPPFDSDVTRPPIYEDGPPDPEIANVRSDDFVMVRDSSGNLSPRIVVYLKRTADATRPAPFVIGGRIREVGALSWRYVPTVPIDGLSISFDQVTAGVAYQVAVRYISADGRVSSWVAITHTVIGHTLPPPDVEAFDVVRLVDGTRRYSWDLGEIPPDVVGVIIKYDAAGSTGTWEGMNLLGQFEGASPLDLPDPSAGSYRFGIKMVDAGGLESVNALFVERTLGAGPQEGIAITADARADGWPGTKTDCHINPSDKALVAVGELTWSTLPAKWSEWKRWNLQPKVPIVYEHPTIDAGFVFDFEPSVSYEVGVDQASLVVFDYSEDGSAWNGYVDIRQFAGRTVRARYARFKITVQNSAPEPIPAIYSFVMNFRAPTFIQDLDNVATGLLDSGHRIGPGHFFAPIAREMFAAIRSVSVTFNGTGAGWTWDLVNKNVDPGPEIRIFNPSHAAEDATVDVRVRGIRSADGSTSTPPPGSLRFDLSRNAVFVGVI